MSPVVSKKMPLLTVAVSDTAHCPCPRLHRFRPASHKSATRPIKTEKGNLARSQIPYSYSNGAEGGTRTPTGFPTTSFVEKRTEPMAPSRWCPVEAVRGIGFPAIYLIVKPTAVPILSQSYPVAVTLVTVAV